MLHLRKALLLVLFVVLGGSLQGQNPADAVAEMEYYLPTDVTYDQSIPTPEKILGMIPGEWHVRHDQLVKYMFAVAEASDRITIEEFGKTYEDRPLLLLTITSASNQKKIEQIRKNHLALTDPQQSADLNLEQMPVVIYMGYSIHGNEPSGSNAALLAAYYLAAAQGPKIEKQLKNMVILLDPSLNPDGLNRFAHWANTRKSKTLVEDPNNMEQNEQWPSGRTNHYWFDLNRDWMLVQHPESQGRIKNFHNWMPNILTDHHEMGTNATFFFQPGIPSRTHPLTPERNQNLTAAIAEYHADILDKNKRLYYTRESYDDFYYGKGSTYPDINGGIGILFEQASARGHAQESIHGVITFPFTIKNQFLTTLSTLEAAQNLRTEILSHQRRFFREARQQASRSDTKAYVFGLKEDRWRTYHLAELLARHNINVYKLAENVSENGERFEAGASFIVPTEQKQHRFIEALFERRTTFPDSLFYDVSSWTMPYAFNLPFVELGSRAFSESQLGAAFEIGDKPEGKIIGGRSEYAYLFEWDEYYAPRALYRIQKMGIRAKVAAEPFTSITAEGTREFDYGTIMVPVGPQQVGPESIHAAMEEIASEDGLRVYGVETGLTPEGIDLGSRTFESLEKPKIAIIAGDGISAYEVGEAWHLLDQRYHMPATLLTKDRMPETELTRYNVIAMVSGSYNDLSDETAEKIRQWVESGGTLIATKYANQWVKNKNIANIDFVTDEDQEGEERKTKPYAIMDRERGAQFIGGTIFNAKLDLTHPIGYGYNDDEITIFRNSTLFMKKAKNPYATPLQYAEEPLASGYISAENADKLKETAAIVVSRVGSGRVISMTDNPNFRAFWYGTNKLFANAIFFGHTISGASAN